jgi:CheY-like chemotaxis protein
MREWDGEREGVLRQIIMKKILIVDDDVDLVENLVQVMEIQGYEVASAHSASDGLRTLTGFKPDLLLLDVMMETDTAGFEMAYQIRSQRPSSRFSEFKDTPIILLTAINQVTNSRFSLDESESFLPEISAFVTKPFRMEELIDKIKKVLD